MLTPIKINALKPRDDGRPYRLSDGKDNPGFGVQVSGKGVKTFYQRYLWPDEGGTKKRRFITLGRYNGKNLAEARARSKKVRDEVADGIEPRQAREKRMKAQNEEILASEAAKAHHAALGTVEQLFEKYKEAPSKRKPGTKRSSNQVGRIYNRDIDPVIGSKKAHEVTIDDIEKILDAIIDRGALVLANRTYSYLKAAFNFGIKWDRNRRRRRVLRFEIPFNPVAQVEKPFTGEVNRTGTRWLKSDEIKQCWTEWQDPEKIALLHGAALRLMLVTAGQRVEEVLGSEWSQFHLDEEHPFWLLPPSLTKNGNEHLVPLNQLALDVLKDIAKHTGDGQFLFSASKNPDRPMDSTFFGRKVRDYIEESEVAKFTARDIRRTAKTHMAQMQPVKIKGEGRPGMWVPVSLEFRNRIQNHAFSDIGSKHYDCWEYTPEKTAILEAWGRRIENIVIQDSGS